MKDINQSNHQYIVSILSIPFFWCIRDVEVTPEKERKGKLVHRQRESMAYF